MLKVIVNIIKECKLLSLCYVIFAFYVVFVNYMQTRPSFALREDDTRYIANRLHVQLSSERSKTLKYEQEIVPVNSSTLLSLDYTEWNVLQGFKVLGTLRNTTGFLTVAVPFTSGRPQLILRTIDSLLHTTSQEDKAKITILIYLSGIFANSSTIDYIKTIVFHKYKSHLDFGHINVFQNTGYNAAPPNSNIVKTSSLLVLEVATITHIASAFQNSYYLQLEDGVYCEDNFPETIQNFITSTSSQQRWRIIDFTKTSFLGKLIARTDLQRFVSVLIAFYEHNNIEYLFYIFQVAALQRHLIQYRRPLFQYENRKSIFIAQNFPIIEDTSNPDAIVVSNFYGFNAKQFYLSGEEIASQTHWLSSGHEIIIIFKDAQIISYAKVESGIKRSGKKSQTLKANISISAEVEIFDISNNLFKCSNLVYIGKTGRNGVFESSKIDSLPNNNKVKCVVITVQTTEQVRTVLRYVKFITK